MQTTVGQVMVNAVLPAKLRDYNRVLDKQGVKELMEKVAQENDPDLYRTVVQALHQVGESSAYSSGSSFGIEDLRTPPNTRVMVQQLQQKVNEVVERMDLTDDQREQVVSELVMKATPAIDKSLYAEASGAKNPFAAQVVSGARGSKGDLRSLLVGDIQVADHRDRLIPVPILHSYAMGVDPAEYWAGTYGARRGYIDVKLNTAKAGFLGKQLVQAAHRQVVTEHDCGTSRGIPVTVDDADNVGALLAEDIGEYKAGTAITPRMLPGLKNVLGDKPLMVRSPLTCDSVHGLCAKCVGIRERGGLPDVGDNVGVASAQALAERVSQGQLGSKHTAGRAKGHELEDDLVGFPLINQLVQVPKSFRGAAAVAKLDGIIREIKDAPQGGKHILLGDTEHFVPVGLSPTVKPGDRVEAGDLLSDGLPNPSDLVEHKGIGAGRLDFVNIFRKAFHDSGLPANRRNIEILTRGLINHVQLVESDGADNGLPDDIVEYSSIERNYTPRYGFRTGSPNMGVGQYMERPVHQYSIGTRVTRKVVDDLNRRGVKEITTHTDPPPFRPQMVRAMEQASVTPDWQTRLGGSYLERGLLDSLHKGVPSQVQSTSYIPALARGKDFGTKLETSGEY